MGLNFGSQGTYKLIGVVTNASVATDRAFHISLQLKSVCSARSQEFILSVLDFPYQVTSGNEIIFVHVENPLSLRPSLS